MKRSTAHDSWYDHQPRDKSTIKPSKNYKAPRGQGRRDAGSEESSRKTDSSQRYTDDSDDTVTRRCEGSLCQREVDWRPRRKTKKPISRKYEEEPNLANCDPYYAIPKNYKTLKKNKKTQKNLISPTPSFLPPTPRKGLISHIRSRLPTAKLSKVVENNSAFKHSASDNSEGEHLHCFHHHHHQQHRRPPNSTEGRYSNQPISCTYHERLDSGAIPSREDTLKPSSGTVDGGKSSKNFDPDVSGNPKRQQFEREVKGSGSDRCYECAACDNPYRAAANAEREIAVHDPLPQNLRQESAGSKETTARTKEKLVYVVEEDGLNPTKLETDLFTVNEILTIKKDLLELSEFAKKLKKLKEMKRDADKAKRSGNPCNCTPASELLEDVNRRIEALEARQEELEKGKPKKIASKGTDSNERKTHVKTTSNWPRTPTDQDPSHEPELGPLQKNPNLMPGTSERPSKPEVIISRAEGFSNNSELVCELMDIKSQLQKLEMRKLSKEIGPQLPQNSDPEVVKKKNHAIAVFSSKTYILASPNNFRRRPDKNCSKSARPEPDRSEGDNWKSKTQKTRENVANWLRNSLPNRSNDVPNDFGVYTAAEMHKDRSREAKNTSHHQVARCRKCNAEFKDEDYEIQEHKQNRASEKGAGNRIEGRQKWRDDHGMGPFFPEMGSRLECRECLLTNSGRFIGLARNSNLQNDDSPPAAAKPTPSPDLSRNLVTSTLMNLLHRSVSSFSVPSAFVASEIIRKPCRNQGSKIGGHVPGGFRLEASRSKSLQELASSGNLKKREKTMRNGFLYSSKGAKESKDSRNKMVKDEKDNDRLTERGNLERGDFPVTSSSRSYLVGEVNLDRNSGLINEEDRNRDTAINNPQIFSTAAVIKSGFDLTDGAVIDEINVISCEEVNKKGLKAKEKKRQKSGRKSSNEKIYICKVCRKERVTSKKRKKKIKKLEKCPPKKKERKKKTRCHVKEVKVPVCPPHRPLPDMSYPSTSVRRPPCVRSGRKNCDYHFRSNIFNRCKRHCECCTKSVRNQALEVPVPVCEQQAPKQECSDYSLQNYIKRCQRRLEEEQSCVERQPEPETVAETKAKETCGLTGFFKSIRGLYPRCSYLKFFPAFGMSCEKEGALRLDPKGSKKLYRVDRGTSIPETYCRNPYRNENLICKQTRTFCSGKSGENCRCVQVYLQTRIKEDEKELEDTSSENSDWNSSCDRSTASRQSEKSCCDALLTRQLRAEDEFMFPYQKSQVYYVGCATEEPHECSKKELKLLKKLQKENCRKKKKVEKAVEKRRKKCVCFVCGNVHKRKKSKKKELTCDGAICQEIKPEPVIDVCCRTSCESIYSRPESMATPVFSFLRSFCSKRAKGSRKRPSTILKKFNEVRSMKVCEKNRNAGRRPRQCCRLRRVACFSNRPVSPPVKECCFASNNSCMFGSKCGCSPQLNSIEERLALLERRNMPPDGQVRTTRKPCPEQSRVCALDCVQSCCFPPPKKKKKKKKKDKRASECSYIDYDICQDSMTAFYCTCPSKSRQEKGDSMDKTTTTTTVTTDTTCTTTDTNNPSTDNTTTTTTTTTTATTVTISNSNQSSDDSKRKDDQCKPFSGLRQRLSSIPTFWTRYIRTREKQKGSKETKLPCLVEDRPSRIVLHEACTGSCFFSRLGELSTKNDRASCSKPRQKNKKSKKKNQKGQKGKAEKKEKRDA